MTQHSLYLGCTALLFAVALFAAPARAEVRTFTSPDGRTVDAEILAATPDQVTLKLAAGQTLVSAINRFSEADQQFIQSWRKLNPAAIKYGFAVTFAKERTGATEKLDKFQRGSSSSTVLIPGQVTHKTEMWVCKMKVVNRSGVTLENVDVDYDIFYTEMDGKESALRKQSGTAKIASIKHLEEQVVSTKEVALNSSSLSGNYRYADGTPQRQKDSLEGVAVVLKHEGKEVFQWASAGVPKNRTAAGKGSGTGGSVFDK